MAADILLDLDENLSPRIAEQLRRRGIDAIGAHDLAALGESDANHLTRAISMERVLVTSDSDFLKLAATGIEHPGIVFGVQEDHRIGDWIKSRKSFVWFTRQTT